VLLGVNMQTSFMHPPFGFALFYLRSVAPAKDYVDKITRKMTPRVTTGQIYWGAVPFVIIQVIMVALVIMLPQMVMVYKGGESKVNPSTIEIEIPSGPPQTEQQEQKQEEQNAESLENAFKAPAEPAKKK
jgi:hypothetical protein